MNDPKTKAEALELTGYEVGPEALAIRPAPLERAWMNETNDAFAYRCLPLNVANQLGWELLCPTGFRASWDGRVEQEGISLEFDAEPSTVVLSHFGSGILTFRVRIVFRTSPGHDLWVSGPVNRPKDGIAPLEGLVETDWLPYTFTMNWIFTRPGHSVRFAAGEPIARIVPYPRGYAERFVPSLRALESDEKLQDQYWTWQYSREAFLESAGDASSEAARAGWQRHYMLGITHDGTEPAEHRTRIALPPFRKAPER